MHKHFDNRQWVGINEYVRHKILRLSILQQVAPINAASASQLIAGIPVPQPADSEIAYDTRFSPLFHPKSNGDDVPFAGYSAEKGLQALLLLRSSSVEPSAMLGDAIAVVSSKFERTLRLSDLVESERSFSSYWTHCLLLSSGIGCGWSWALRSGYWRSRTQAA